MLLTKFHFQGGNRAVMYPEFAIPADCELRADLGFTFGDACVSLDGYPIPILPPGGVMQIAAYEAINADVHAQRSL